MQASLRIEHDNQPLALIMVSRLAVANARDVVDEQPLLELLLLEECFHRVADVEDPERPGVGAEHRHVLKGLRVMACQVACTSSSGRQETTRGVISVAAVAPADPARARCRTRSDLLSTPTAAPLSWQTTTRPMSGLESGRAAARIVASVPITLRRGDVIEWR